MFSCNRLRTKSSSPIFLMFCRLHKQVETVSTFFIKNNNPMSPPRAFRKARRTAVGPPSAPLATAPPPPSLSSPPHSPSPQLPLNPLLRCGAARARDDNKLHPAMYLSMGKSIHCCLAAWASGSLSYSHSLLVDKRWRSICGGSASLLAQVSSHQVQWELELLGCRSSSEFGCPLFPSTAR